MRLRVGLIGLGDDWENRHRPALRALSDRFEVKAVCAEISARAAQVAREFEATPVDGFRALSARTDIDAVLVFSPDWVGPLPILAACEAGKAVYSSGILHIDPDKAREIKQRVEASGAAFMAEFPRRHAPATLRLKELIATQLGTPRLLFCHQRRVEHVQNGSIRRNKHPRAALREMMELVDWCRYVVGQEPTSVIAAKHASTENPQDDDYQMMSLDFSAVGNVGTGPLAQISSGKYLQSRWHEAISFRPPAALQVCCERGVAFIDLPATLIWFDEAGRHMESLENERPVGEQLLMQFHRAVTSLVLKASDLEDAYRALTIVQASRTSCLEGRRLPLQF